jgi:hypothetical protein
MFLPPVLHGSYMLVALQIAKGLAEATPLLPSFSAAISSDMQPLNLVL